MRTNAQRILSDIRKKVKQINFRSFCILLTVTPWVKRAAYWMKSDFKTNLGASIYKESNSSVQNGWNKPGVLWK